MNSVTDCLRSPGVCSFQQKLAIFVTLGDKDNNAL